VRPKAPTPEPTATRRVRPQTVRDKDGHDDDAVTRLQKNDDGDNERDDDARKITVRVAPTPTPPPMAEPPGEDTHRGDQPEGEHDAAPAASPASTHGGDDEHDDDESD
jgi:hypothetical protein